MSCTVLPKPDVFQGHLSPQPWTPTAVAGPALAAQLPQRCLGACSCKPCGREGMHKDVASAGPAEQDAQRDYHKKQTLPESSERESRGASMQGPGHIGRFVGQVAGRQPQTWDCLGLHVQFEKIVWPTALQHASQTLVECKIPCSVMCSSAAHSYNKFGSSAVGFQIY